MSPKVLSDVSVHSDLEKIVCFILPSASITFTSRGRLWQGHPTDRFVNYLFGGLLIPSDFLRRIVPLNFRDMRHLMSVVFGLLKMSFRVPKKGQLSFSER